MRTLLDRSDVIITHSEDRVEEEEHIEGALTRCGYPKWAMDRVRRQKAEKAETKKPASSKTQAQRSAGSVVLPYSADLSESIARVLKKHNIQSAMRPALILRRSLLHPKDKRSLEETVNSVYKKPCKQCPRVYIGELGRRLCVRVGEHKKDVDGATARFAGLQRKSSMNVFNKSALTDHVSQSNHVIDWSNIKVVGR